MAQQNLPVWTINQLPDLALQAVFEQMPLTDQFQNLFVSKYFRSVQLKSFATRESLPILIGDPVEALRQIKDSPFRSNYTIDYQVEGSLPDVTNLQLSDCFLLEPLHSTDALVAAFPRVTTLQISLLRSFDANFAIQCDKIIELLHSNWAESITSLEFYIDNSEKYKLLSILSAINQMSGLKKLTFGYVGFISENLDLPILAQLHELRFDSYDNAKPLFTNLLKYALSNESLQVIEIGNSVYFTNDDYRALLAFPTKLKSKFRFLNVGLQLVDLFCNAFTELTRLKINLSKWTIAEIKALAQLNQLIELTCSFNANKGELIAIGTPLSAIPVLFSVQYVGFYVYGIRQHQELLRCHLPHIFANVRWLNLNCYDWNQCDDCKWYTSTTGRDCFVIGRKSLKISDNLPGVTETCVRRLMAPLKGQFGQLMGGTMQTYLTKDTNRNRWTLEELWSES